MLSIDLQMMSQRALGWTLLPLFVLTMPQPGLAQESGSDARVRKLEAEVRALQRRVFPGGDGRFFEPEISSQTADSAGAAGSPSTTSSALTDVLTRLDAIELQLQRLTAQNEVNSNQISGLDMRMRALEGLDSDSALGAEGAATPQDTSGSGAQQADQSASSASRSIETPSSENPPAAGPSPERIAGVQAITKPQSDDVGDDEYSYGFRLWNAGYFPEAQQQLSKFVEDYPSHWRTTYGRNLLGRAYLDNGQPRDAAPWFLRNYQNDKQAARAGDSLLFLAEAMIALEDTERACIALAEFSETYPALATGRLQDRYLGNTRKVTC